MRVLCMNYSLKQSTCNKHSSSEIFGANSPLREPGFMVWNKGLVCEETVLLCRRGVESNIGFINTFFPYCVSVVLPYLWCQYCRKYTGSLSSIIASLSNSRGGWWRVGDMFHVCWPRMTPVDWRVTIATEPVHRVVCCYSKIATTANENSPDGLNPRPYSKTLKESDWSHA